MDPNKYWLITYCFKHIESGIISYSTIVSNKHPVAFLQECIDLEEKAKKSYYHQYAIIYTATVHKSVYDHYVGKLSS